MLPHREAQGHCTSSDPSTFATPISTTGSDLCSDPETQQIQIPEEGMLELKWWITNLELQEGCPLKLQPPDLIICSDAAKTGGWGAVCHLGATGGAWSKEERELNINVQELLAAELAIKTFTKDRKPKAIHMRIDNTSALSYLVKMGGREVSK